MIMVMLKVGKIPILVHFLLQNGGRRGHSKIKSSPPPVAEQVVSKPSGKNNTQIQETVRNEVQRDCLLHPSYNSILRPFRLFSG